MIKYTRMDHRYTGHPHFKYIVDIDTNVIPMQVRKYNKFLEIRDWCTSTWGKSCERNMYLDYYWWKIRSPSMYQEHPPPYELSENWCWYTEEYKFRFYLKSSQELHWMLLRFEEEID